MSHPKRTLTIVCECSFRFTYVHAYDRKEGESPERDESLIPRRVVNVDQSTEPC